MGKEITNHIELLGIELLERLCVQDEEGRELRKEAAGSFPVIGEWYESLYFSPDHLRCYNNILGMLFGLRLSGCISPIEFDTLHNELLNIKCKYRMSYEEHRKCDCGRCEREGKEACPHRAAHRRIPAVDGGLGLCPNLRDL